MVDSPTAQQPQLIHSPAEAVAQLKLLYQDAIDKLHHDFERFISGREPDHKPLSSPATYPYIRITTTERPQNVDSRRAYGYLSQPGTYETTITRPDLFEDYLLRQLELIRSHHDVPFEIGASTTPIPIHFAVQDDWHIESDLTEEQMFALPHKFPVPDLVHIDDTIVNGDAEPISGIKPLSLFSALRTDISLQRLRHYTGTDPRNIQNFVIFTNYQFYIDEFITLSKQMLRDPESDYTALITPFETITYDTAASPDGDFVHTPHQDARQPQMPAYHLVRQETHGITLINIGVGPSNAKTITDHVAVLRPHAWLMLGHCAGLRNSQKLGDYVLAHAYLREDHVLDYDLPVSIPLPALSEVQIALTEAVGDITGSAPYEVKNLMRTGTVATVDDRNWEVRNNADIIRRLSISRAIALDMESATIAANGFRYRVPYGTLLCVSDKPLHGQLKLPGMANAFYRQQVDQHLQIGVKAMERLQKVGMSKLHSRKLRSFNEVAFQ